jgi:uncharacterized protein (TIGR03067 family)
MTTHAAVVLFAAVLVSAVSQPYLADSGDKRIDGNWLVESIVRDPREKGEGEAKGLRVVISGQKVVVKAAGEDKVLGKAIIKIDAAAKPKAIDITGEGETDAVLGIYELEGDTLKLSFAPPKKKQRPTEVSATPGSQQTVLTLKRKK